jgi:hypothetical protein
MEMIEGSETSAISNQTQGKHPKENILHVKHGESLKSRRVSVFVKVCEERVPEKKMQLTFT